MDSNQNTTRIRRLRIYRDGESWTIVVKMKENLRIRALKLKTDVKIILGSYETLGKFSLCYQRRDTTVKIYEQKWFLGKNNKKRLDLAKENENQDLIFCSFSFESNFNIHGLNGTLKKFEEKKRVKPKTMLSTVKHDVL